MLATRLQIHRLQQNHRGRTEHDSQGTRSNNRLARSRGSIVSRNRREASSPTGRTRRAIPSTIEARILHSKRRNRIGAIAAQEVIRAERLTEPGSRDERVGVEIAAVFRAVAAPGRRDREVGGLVEDVLDVPVGAGAGGRHGPGVGHEGFAARDAGEAVLTREVACEPVQDVGAGGVFGGWLKGGWRC